MSNIFNKVDVFTMLKAQAEANKQKALMTLKLLSEHPAGIGDHSTKDFYNNAEEALQMLVDAEDQIETINKYFSTEMMLKS
jgi:hypothetical protein